MSNEAYYKKTDNKMFCCQFSVPSDTMSTYKGDQRSKFQEKGGNTPNHKQPKHFHINRLYSYTDLHQCALLLLVLMLCYDVHCMPSLCVRHNLTSILFFMGVKELFMQFLCSYSGLFPQVFHSNLFALKS